MYYLFRSKKVWPPACQTSHSATTRSRVPLPFRTMSLERPNAVMIAVMTATLLLAAPSSIAAQAAARDWQLPSRPSLVIGDLNDTPERTFGRIAGVVRLSDGTIVAADQQALQVRFFGPDGRFIKAAGRTGGGPGEFRAMLSLHRCAGDTVVVYDPSALRLTYLGPRGDLIRTTSVQSMAEGGAPPYEVACNNSGQFLLVNRSPARPEGIGPRRLLLRLTLASTSASASPVLIDTVRATERYFDGQNDFARPLGRVMAAVVGGSRAWVSTGDAGGLRAYDLTGRSLGVVATAPGARVRITPAVLDRFIEDELDRNATGDRAARERLLRSLPYPAELPVYRRLLVDAQDRLWIETYPTPGATSIRWTVLSPTGQRIGAVNVPAEFRLHDAGVDGLVGAGLSEDGVPQIWRFTLDSRRSNTR